MKPKFTAVFIVGLLYLVGCSNAQQKGEVIAEVNESKLTYDFLLDQFPGEIRASITKEQLLQAIDAWIETELLYQEALKHNIDKDKQVKNILEQKSKEIIAGRYADLAIYSEIKVDQREIDSLYNSRKDMFKNDEEMLNLSHIVLNTEGAANAVYKRLKEGDDFAILAADFSEDNATRKNSGELGFLPVSAIEEDIIKALNKIKNGQFTPPIKSQSGYYHIFLLKDRRPPGIILPLEEIRQDIAEMITAEKWQVVYNDFINRLKSSASIKKYPLK
jgi:foldase protein PrsA